MLVPKCEFCPEGETEVRILFDLRIPGSVERMHHGRTVWQEQSDVEALDMHHFIVIIRLSEVVQEAA
jgi:hypothetical protein